MPNFRVKFRRVRVDYGEIELAEKDLQSALVLAESDDVREVYLFQAATSKIETVNAFELKEKEPKNDSG